MILIEDRIYSKVQSIITSWVEKDIYAISFFVYSNEAYRYKEFNNVSYFAISYNTEKDCGSAGQYDEERWNYAYWRQDEIPIIDPDNPDELTDLLFEWYRENGIDHVGYEDDDACYDSEMHYIGRGPAVHYELLTIVSQVAKRLQQEGVISDQFGKRLPIIIHGLEYAWYDIEATRNANTNGEAHVFLQAMEELGMM